MVGVTKVEDILLIFDYLSFFKFCPAQVFNDHFLLFFAICHCQRKKGGKAEVGGSRNNRMEEEDNTGAFDLIYFLTNSIPVFSFWREG